MSAPPSTAPRRPWFALAWALLVAVAYALARAHRLPFGGGR